VIPVFREMPDHKVFKEFKASKDFRVSKAI
jgi:hypothetical protein